VTKSSWYSGLEFELRHVLEQGLKEHVCYSIEDGNDALVFTILGDCRSCMTTQASDKQYDVKSSKEDIGVGDIVQIAEKDSRVLVGLVLLAIALIFALANVTYLCCFSKPRNASTESVRSFKDFEDFDSVQGKKKAIDFQQHDRFEILAPAGKLGILIDRCDGECPHICGIRPDSPLIQQLHVGDKLVSIDHEDVTNVAAKEVSRIINLKSDSERTLVFLRLIDNLSQA
jgi:hypothetical protein